MGSRRETITRERRRGDPQCPVLSASTPPRTEPASGWRTREMKLVGAQPTSLTPAPTTDHLTPHTVPTQHRTMETPELGGPLSETAPLTTLLGLLAIGVPPGISAATGETSVTATAMAAAVDTAGPGLANMIL